jgi:hypothetical protein
MGNDSVVIMTTAQGRKINELFEKNDKELVKLRDSVTFTHRVIDSLKVIKDTMRVERDTLTSKYLLMKSMYEDMKWRRDTNIVIFKKEEKVWKKHVTTVQYIMTTMILFIMFWSTTQHH